MRWLELSAAVLGLWLSSIPTASRAAEGTFGLLTFQAGADLRLGATRGDGEDDVVDVATGVPAPVVPLRAGATVGGYHRKAGELRNRVVAKAESRTTQ